MRIWKTLLTVIAVLALAAGRALAGPPFVTDDPEPVDYHHWEVYISSIYQHELGQSAGTLPHLEVNNGLAPNLQLHLIVPNAFFAAPGGPTNYGIGDVELGSKWRFVQEHKQTPMVGIFPLLELPTGEASRGLGTGYLHTFLPIWIQKSWGPWTTYGGGGYWISPGTGNRNSWQVGWLLQKDLNKHWTLGGELFYFTPASTDHTALGGRYDFNFNFGGQYNFDDGHHLLFSFGRSITGSTNFMSYIGYQWTFGPHEAQTQESTSRRSINPGLQVFRSSGIQGKTAISLWRR